MSRRLWREYRTCKLSVIVPKSWIISCYTPVPRTPPAQGPSHRETPGASLLTLVDLARVIISW